MGINSSRYYEETAATPGAEYLSALPLDYGLRLGWGIDDHLPPGGVVFADTDEWILNSFAGRTFPVVPDMRLPDVQIVPPSGALVVQMKSGSIDEVPFAHRVQNLSLPDGWNIALDQYAPATMPEINQPQQVESQQGNRVSGL